MLDLFKRNKEPLHITRETVFDNESIPAAALDGDLERRVAALEKLGRDIEPRFNDLVDIHKKEITVHHANEVARKARMDAESAARISSGTIDTHELNTTNIGEQKRPTKPKKQPHVRIEFDNISNPTVWLDGDKVEALETLDVNWVTDTDQKNTKKFEISYLDLNNPNGPFIKRGQTNQQSSRVNNKPDHVKATIAIDSSQLVESIKEFKQSLGHKTTLPTVYTSKEKPTNPHIGDLWISSYSKYERDGIVVSASYKQWDGWMWVPMPGL